MYCIIITTRNAEIIVWMQESPKCRSMLFSDKIIFRRNSDYKFKVVTESATLVLLQMLIV